MRSVDLQKCIVKKCKSAKCKIDNQNVQVVYSLDICLNDRKMCDCLIVCKNSNIVLVEILCGKLTFSEFKDKVAQLQNCINFVHATFGDAIISKVILLYETIDEEKRKDGNLKRKLLNTRITHYKITTLQSKNFNGVVC